jgi:hypothetical protein
MAKPNTLCINNRRFPSRNVGRSKYTPHVGGGGLAKFNEEVAAAAKETIAQAEAMALEEKAQASQLPEKLVLS